MSLVILLFLHNVLCKIFIFLLFSVLNLLNINNTAINKKNVKIITVNFFIFNLISPLYIKIYFYLIPTSSAFIAASIFLPDLILIFFISNGNDLSVFINENNTSTSEKLINATRNLIVFK